MIQKKLKKEQETWQLSVKVSDDTVSVSKENNKVYIEIVQQLREIIKKNNLIAGDKIPSERELSERLQVGRSSVREALRALELLGLIETRRGEGTFICDFRNHQFVQLLSTFILQDNEKAKQDVYETKSMLEMDSIRFSIQRATSSELMELARWVEETNKFSDVDFFEKVFRLSANELCLKIWLILIEYFHSIHKDEFFYKKKNYTLLVQAMASRDEAQALMLYHRLKEEVVQ